MAMSDNPEGTKVFEVIQRACIDCVKDPRVDTIRKLREVIEQCNPAVANSILKYLVFPLQKILSNAVKQSSKDIGIICETCQCIQSLFEKITLDSFDIFAELFVSLFWLSDKRVSSTSEDLITHSIEAVYDVIKYSNLSVIQDALNDELFTRALSHAVSVLVSIPIDEPSKSLKISSLKTLEILVMRSHNVVIRDAKQAAVVRKTWKEFLPGISVSIHKLLLMDDKHPQGLIACSFNVLSLVLSTSFPLSSEKEIKKDSSSDDFKKTCENLKMILKRLSQTFVVSRWTSVKLSLLSLATLVITNTCPTFTEQLNEVLLEVPITLSCDIDEEVRSKAASFIQNHLEQEMTDTPLKDRLEESLETKVIECMRSMEDSIESMSPDAKIQKLQFLSGLLTLFSSSLYTSFSSIPSNRNQLMRFLMTAAAVNLSSKENLTVVKDTSRRQNVDVHLTHFPETDDPNARPVFEHFISILAQKMEREVLYDFINQLEDHKSPHSLLIILNILKKVDEQETLLSCVNYCTQFLRDISQEQMQQEIRLLLNPTRKGDPTKRPMIQSSSKDHHTLTILLLKVIFVCLPRLKEKPEVLRKDLIGVSHTIFKFHHFSSFRHLCDDVLDTIARCTGYRSRFHFVRQNLSFFIQKLEEDYLKYSSAFCSPSLPRNLRSVLLIASSEEKEVGDQITVTLLPFTLSLLELLDISYSLKPTFILQSLLVIIISFECEKATPSSATMNEIKQRSQFLKLTEFEEKWKEFLRNKAAAERGVASEANDGIEDLSEANGDLSEENGDICKDIPENDRPKELSSKLKISHSILDRVSKLLSIPDANDRMTVIQIISKCCQLLASEEDSLLPLVHRSWKLMILRLNDEDPAVASSAFVFLDSLSNICGDFVRSRMSKEVLPRVNSFLIKHCKDSLRIGHKYTATFKYQLQALQRLGSIAVGLDLEGKELWKVIQVLVSYVQGDQELRDASISSLKTIASFDSESVWFYCQEGIHKCTNERDIIFLQSIAHS